MRTLLVDDNSDTVELYGEYFSILGHEVHLASTAGEALDLVSSNQYDSILLDILLPDLDGYTLAANIRRAEPPGVRAVIVAISGMARDTKHPFLTEADFDAYLLKPAPLETIVAALRLPTPG